MKLGIIIASTRPGRIGDQVGKWIADYAVAHTDFEVSVEDLKEINLPIFDEPGHPMMGVYQNEHTKDWSRRIGSADAFVIVTPEYNYNMPPSLLNAVDYLHHEWKYKPVGFVGYGGTGAMRAIMGEKQLFNTLGAMPIPSAVNLPGVFRPVMETFTPEPKQEELAAKMLGELRKVAEALKSLRD